MNVCNKKINKRNTSHVKRRKSFTDLKSKSVCTSITNTFHREDEKIKGFLFYDLRNTKDKHENKGVKCYSLLLAAEESLENHEKYAFATRCFKMREKSVCSCKAEPVTREAPKARR